MSQTRETTVSVNLRERPESNDIRAAIAARVRPWFDAIEAEGFSFAPPDFTLTEDSVDPWTTHVHVRTEVS